MAPEKDYTHRSWIAVTLLIAVLIGLSLIPPQTLGGVSLRRANILSDLISFEEDLEKAEKAIDLDDADFHIDLTQVARQIADTVPQHAPTTYEWNLREEADDTTAQPRLPDSVRLSPTLIPIEDFDTTGHSRLTAFYEKLQKGDAPVRIAVMGDSFVEGDILSSDLREKLQLRRFRGRFRSDGFAADRFPAHDQNPVQRLGLLQHHATAEHPRRHQRLLLHLGLALPTFGRSLRSLGRFIGPGLPGQLPHGPDPVRQP